MHFSSPVLTHSAYHTWRGSQPYSFKTSTWLCTVRTRRQVSQSLRSLVRAAVCVVRDRWLPCQARSAFSPPKSSFFKVCLVTNRRTLYDSRSDFNLLLSRITQYSNTMTTIPEKERENAFSSSCGANSNRGSSYC